METALQTQRNRDGAERRKSSRSLAYLDITHSSSTRSLAEKKVTGSM